MRPSFSAFAALTAIVPLAHAAPTPTSNLPPTGVLSGLVQELGSAGVALANNDAIQDALRNVGDGLETDAAEISQAVSAFAAVITAATVSPRPAPTDFKGCQSLMSSILYDAKPTNIIQPAVELVLNSVNPIGNKGINGQLSGALNSFDNVQPARAIAAAAHAAVFPKKNPADAPYSRDEATYRKGIYIPPTFTYGRKPPIILIPGTGSTGGDTFAGNMIPLLTASSFADPVWLNIPGYLLDDAQVSAEYVAYATNYINAITGHKNVTLLSWSQGGIDAQWALKYWPSARHAVTDLVAVSPDYHGTVLAYAISPAFPQIPEPATILQQQRNSSFISTLRAHGGDSAYVPTTNIYSSFFDEIVEPQTGTQASGFLLDARRVGASNNEVQALCPGSIAGGFYSHEGVLYHPLTFALLRDAMAHPGPGQYARLDRAALCASYATEGLSVLDVLDTEAAIPQAALNIVLTFPKYFTEPALFPHVTAVPAA